MTAMAMAYLDTPFLLSSLSHQLHEPGEQKPSGAYRLGCILADSNFTMTMQSARKGEVMLGGCRLE